MGEGSRDLSGRSPRARSPQTCENDDVKFASELKSGAAFLFRGLGVLLRAPRLALLGMVPPFVVSVVMVTLLALFSFLGLGPLTEFATGWVPESIRMVARVLLGILAMVLAVVIAVVLFASITLAVGAPIYEKISESVQQGFGETALARQESTFASVTRGLRQSTAIIGLSLVFGVVAFLLGLIPVVGGVVGSLAGAIVAGFLVVVEMISGPFDRWGQRRLSEKFRAVNRNRGVALGFGLPAVILLSVPLLAVLLFPVITAGGTLLARELRGENVPVVVQPRPAR